MLKVTKDSLYEMLKQAGYLKIPVNVQAVGSMSEYCKYHQQFGQDIDSCEEFNWEVEGMMARGVLRLTKHEEDDLIGTLIGYGNKEEVC